MILPGGIPSIHVVDAERRQAEDAGAIIVDVREPNEYARVRIEGSALFPLSSFAQRFSELPRDRPILVLCQSGSRSLAATAHLLRNGWPEVINVAGGIDAWRQAGLPVRIGPVAPGEGELPDGPVRAR
jgi:rhodanese-related sulfurtransferase